MDKNIKIAEKFLEKAVNLNSDSYNFKGIKNVAELLKNYLDEALEVRQIKENGHISTIIDNKCDEPIASFLLVGHIDTVFRENWDIYRKNNDKVTGPGTIDMKAGISMIVNLLNNFSKTKHLRLRAIINSDEEIGSSDSKKYFKQYSKGFHHAMVFEGVREDQGIIYKRKGITEITVHSKGIAAHAGSFFFKGKNAIFPLCQFINRVFPEVEKLYDNGVTLNLAKIQGGDKINVVPNDANVYFDLRYFDEKDLKKVKEIFSEFRTKELDISYRDSHSPMNTGFDREIIEKLQKSFTKYNENCTLDETGGASDGNTLAKFGLKVIDGMGPKGGGDHTINEYFIYSSYINRLHALNEFFGSF